MGNGERIEEEESSAGAGTALMNVGTVKTDAIQETNGSQLTTENQPLFSAGQSND